ncbi:MAG: dihydrolipoamide acyltransferase [Actinobacteria bacterium]|nr:dihydrolipoamide acyltransferase [Actinomycetota bacterium]
MLGRTHSATYRVQPDQTAEGYSNTGIAVLATPVLAGYVEETAVLTVAPALAAGEASVGAHLALNHQRPTVPGEWVTVTATVTRVEGDDVTFEFTASDPARRVANGVHVRRCVAVVRLMAGAHRRAGQATAAP